MPDFEAVVRGFSKGKSATLPWPGMAVRRTASLRSPRVAAPLNVDAGTRPAGSTG